MQNKIETENQTTILSGDTIVVPIEIRTYPGVKLANEVTQIIYQIAVSTAAVNSF